MLGPRELLHRFRLMAVPGRPTAAGVPTDRAAALELELAPLLAALRVAEDEAATVVSSAEKESARQDALTAQEATRLVAESRQSAVTARADAAAARLAAVERDQQAIQTAAGEEALRIERVSEQRLPAAVEDLVRRVLATGLAASSLE
jgi:hypothetical protein